MEFGRGFIEFCLAKNFNIHRVPGFEQFYRKDGTAQQMFHEYKALKEDDIEAACAELAELYDFVQKELLKSKYVKDGKITLVRSLRNYEIKEVTPQLLNPKNNKISMPVNIMNSYAYDENLFCYGSTMSIVREVEIEKIVMFDECLHHPQNECVNLIHGGEYEVWVLEDNMFGKIELDRECFKYNALNENIKPRTVPMSEYVFEGSLYKDERIWKRPCERGRFTTWLINHNKHIIMKEHGVLEKKNK